MVRSTTAALLIACVPGLAGASEVGTTCETFTINLANEKLSFLDEGATGVSPGDRRFGRYRILDDSEAEIGTFLFDAVTMPATDDGVHHMLGQGFYELPGGQLTIAMHYKLTDPSDTTQATGGGFVYPVTSGTGAFLGAEGTLRSTRADDGGRVHTFEITCG
ncbi:MAG: hypothetical protein ROR55_22800 [Devosia sp.]